MTELQTARQGDTSSFILRVAELEHVDPDALRRGLAEGLIVAPRNAGRTLARPCGIGKGLRTKVNANIGTSHDYADPDQEMLKLKAALDAGADTVMDLSTGGDLPDLRRRILENSPVPVGTVPIYDAAVHAARQSRQGLHGMSADDILAAVRRHCEDGVDFVTLHCAVTRDVVRHLRERPRVCGIVSRGGTFIAGWMRVHGQENPLYERYDEVLDILREHDVTISLGDGLRPGALADAFDPAQVHELEVMAGLADRARAVGVQTMIEGPGHVPMQQVESQVKLQKALCKGAPFYVLGPIVTDVAPGYDHITAAIGGAMAAAAGADYLCYVTPAEHLALPTAEDVREGVIATRIAAHAGDIAKGIPGAREWDQRMSALRRRRDWEGQIAEALDPVRARTFREQRLAEDREVCSMCGEFCVFKILDEEGIAPQRGGNDGE